MRPLDMTTDYEDSQLLLAEDDFRWVNEFEPYDISGNVHVVRSFSDALLEIESGKQWTWGIFDQVLHPGNCGMPPGMQFADLGVMLAWAFQSKFPGRPVAVVTGGDTHNKSARLKELISSKSCIYVGKHEEHAKERIQTTDSLSGIEFLTISCANRARAILSGLSSYASLLNPKYH